MNHWNIVLSIKLQWLHIGALNTAEKSLAYMSNNSYQQKQNQFLNLFK